jgi:hypothetical protein
VGRIDKRTRFVLDGAEYEHADPEPDHPAGSVTRRTEPPVIAQVPLAGGGTVKVHGYAAFYSQEWVDVCGQTTTSSTTAAGFRRLTYADPQRVNGGAATYSSSGISRTRKSCPRVTATGVPGAGRTTTRIGVALVCPEHEQTFCTGGPDSSFGAGLKQVSPEDGPR